MSKIPLDPDEVPRFEVHVYESEALVVRRGFSTLETAEAFADECTDEMPGRRSSIEDVGRTHSFEDEVRADTALAEEYPRGSGATVDVGYE